MFSLSYLQIKIHSVKSQDIEIICHLSPVMFPAGEIFKIIYFKSEIITRYNEALDGLPVQVLPHYPKDDETTASCGHLYICRLLNKTMEERNEIIAQMAERGIASNVHYKPLPMMTAYKALGFDIKDYPNAYDMYHNEITLPLHTRLSDEDVEYVIGNFVELIK